MKELTLNDLAQSHADQAKAALDRGRGADMTTRGKCYAGGHVPRRCRHVAGLVRLRRRISSRRYLKRKPPDHGRAHVPFRARPQAHKR